MIVLRLMPIAAVLVLGSCSSPQRLDPPAAPPQAWPSLRGPNARGFSDGHGLPRHWSAETGEGIQWKVPLPGPSHSSPVVWGDSVYLVVFVPGDGGVGPVELRCLDARTGETRWTETLSRHVREAADADATPVTDGRIVATLVGGRRLSVHDVDGTLRWRADLSRERAAWPAADDAGVGRNATASPILDRGRLFVEGLDGDRPFLLAAAVEDGTVLWRVFRDEPCCGSTPTLVPSAGGDLLVTQGPASIRAHDADDGRVRWQVDRGAWPLPPTPVPAQNLVIVASGALPRRPILAIESRAGGEVRWELPRGPRGLSPLVYRRLLYVLYEGGAFDCYDVATGHEIYRERLPHRGIGFRASPVAADGKLYLFGEDGETFVVRAGARFELDAVNAAGERILASPAIAGGRLFLRGEHHLFSIGAGDG